MSCGWHHVGSLQRVHDHLHLQHSQWLPGQLDMLAGTPESGKPRQDCLHTHKKKVVWDLKKWFGELIEKAPSMSRTSKANSKEMHSSLGFIRHQLNTRFLRLRAMPRPCRKPVKQEAVEKKEESNVKMDESEDENCPGIKSVEESEEIQVRDIRYNLETLVWHCLVSPTFFGCEAVAMRGGINYL